FYFDTTTWISSVFGWAENRLWAALNKAGPTFPSFYELLPIQSSEYCRQAVPDLAQLSPVLVAGEDKLWRPVNIFKEDVWDAYKFYQKIQGLGVDVDKLRGELKGMLQKAEAFACDIVAFNPLDVASSVYFLGQETKTVSSVRLTMKRPRDQLVVGY